MTTTLTDFSEQIAETIARAAPSIVQVHGRRRPASGVAFGADAVLTTVRALGREDGLQIRTHDGTTADAGLAGWDHATGLALLKTSIPLAPARQAESAARVGHLTFAVGRSWSNALTASSGIVAVIGGPLRTGRNRSIEQVLRTTAPMHDGFAGGALIDAAGGVIGIATATAIRGLGVAIPAAIAWRTAAHILEHGRPKMGFLGIAGYPVRMSQLQRERATRDRALLVAGVTEGSPAAAAGILVGDLLLDFDHQSIESAEDLLGLLGGDRIGRPVPVRALRGDRVVEVTVSIIERPAA
jgi:S1-C subfamily serine protease